MSKKFLIVGIASISLILTIAASILVFSNHQGNNYNEVEKQFSYDEVSSVDELADKAQLIIIAEPVNDIKDDKSIIDYYKDTNIISQFHSLREVKVDKVLKGEISEDSILIGETAGLIENSSGEKELLIPQNYSVVQKDKKYIFFLRKSDNNYYTIMAINQAKFNIDNTDLKEKDCEVKDSHFKNLKNEVLIRYGKEINYLN